VTGAYDLDASGNIIGMRTIAADVIIVVAVVSGALIFRAVLERMWPLANRRAHNDIIGWQLSVLGTTYAVIVAFMLYAVWADYGRAEVNTEAEANAAVNIYRLAEGLPSQQRDEIKSAVVAYVDAILNKDWPAMARGDSSSLESHNINREMWQILMTVKTATPEELTVEDHTLYELSALAEHRRVRILQSNSRLPGILWWLLIFGAIVTILSSCMFGASNKRLHNIQLVFISSLIALALIATAEIDRPFQGLVHVSDSAFRRAQANVRQP
jgi:hypothetical protein